jgi:DNA-binding CsgD family transcriptional regulator
VVPAWLVVALTELLRLDIFCAYRPERGPLGNWGMSSGAVRAGPDGFFERYDAAMGRHPQPFLYDPLRPEPSQRNRVSLLRDLCAHGPDVTCVAEELLPEVGLANHDQIRVLISSSRNSPILAWVGGFRAEPFAARDTDVITALVGVLRRTLALRRKLVDANLIRADFDATLGVLMAPAFVVRGDGGVVHANPVGASLLDRLSSSVRARLREAVRGHDRACDVARLTSEGHGELFLVLLREPQLAFEHRLAQIARLWGATRRESDVVRWLSLGDSNKEIALRLKCHESSVERHVTSLLRKARCDSRSRMVARFWTAR